MATDEADELEAHKAAVKDNLKKQIRENVRKTHCSAEELAECVTKAKFDDGWLDAGYELKQMKIDDPPLAR